MSYSVATRRGLGQAAGGAVVVNAPTPGMPLSTSGGSAPVIGSAPQAATMPAGWNPNISLAVLRYPQTELNALDNYDLSGTLRYPNSSLLMQSQVQLVGTCDEVLSKVFLIDLYEKARTALAALLSYNPAPLEQKQWYDAAQGWMQIWCRATSIQGGTFQAAMSVSRLLKTPFDDKAPWPEVSTGQALSRQISTYVPSGVATTTVVGTPYDLYGFQSPYPVQDGRENANLAWPAPGPDEQYFGMPIWATFLLRKYPTLSKEMQLNHSGHVVVTNCGNDSTFSKRQNLTDQGAAPQGLPYINYGHGCANSGDVTWHYHDELVQSLASVRQQMGLPVGSGNQLQDYATGVSLDDDHLDLWAATDQYPIDVVIAVLDAQTSLASTANQYDTFYRAIRSFSGNPLAKIASDLGGVFWQTGTAATGWMMCDAIKQRMAEMAGTAFMPLLARSMTQYAAFLNQPENIALAGESAGQITQAADAAAQSGVETAAQVGEAVGAAIMVFGGIGTVIGGIVAGLSALMGFLGSLITTQAYAPPPLWYRILDHCNGQDLATAGIAAIVSSFQHQQLVAHQASQTIAAQAQAYVNGVRGNGETGTTSTAKVALITGGGIFATAFAALIVRKARSRRAPAASVSKNRRRSHRPRRSR